MIVPLLITVDPIVFLFSMFQVILCFDHSKIAKVITFFENLKNITKIFREKKKDIDQNVARRNKNACGLLQRSSRKIAGCESFGQRGHFLIFNIYFSLLVENKTFI